jgi:hypothetical protein
MPKGPLDRPHLARIPNHARRGDTGKTHVFFVYRRGFSAYTCLQQRITPRRSRHEIGSRDPRWPYPSAEWVRDCEQLVELDAKLPALLRGEYEPADADEWISFARICKRKGRHEDSARSYAKAFELRPELADDPRFGHRSEAASAAAEAASGKSAYGQATGESASDRWRKQAFDWLQADLRVFRKLLETGEPADHRGVQSALQRWQRDPDLAGLRDPRALEHLPEAERKAWQQLWVDVEGMLRKRAVEQKNEPMNR